MKKLAIVVILLVLVAAGVAGGSYFLGNSIEKEYFNALAKYGQWGPFTLSNKSYEHGLISSKVQTVLTIADTAAEGGENATVVFEHTIWHGPLALTTPGGSGIVPVPAAAVIETRLVSVTPVPDELKSMVAEVPALSKSNMLLTIGLDGHVTGDLKIPAFDKEKDGVKVGWGGFTMSVGVSKDKSKIAGSLEMPKLNVNHGNDTVSVGAVKGRFDMTEYLPMLYLGTSKISFDSIDAQFADYLGAQKQFALKGFTVDASSNKNGNAIDIVENINLASLNVENATYGPIESTIELKNLDAQALSDFQVQMRSVYTSLGADPQKLEGQFDQIMAMYKDLFAKCLKGSPEIRISKLNVKTSKGDGNAHFMLKFAPGANVSLDNPLALLQNIESSADIAVQEKLLKSLLVDEIRREMLMNAGDGSPEFGEAELQKLADEQFDAQIKPMLEQKFVLREGDTLKSSATFKAGKLQVNGKDTPLF